MVVEALKNSEPGWRMIGSGRFRLGLACGCPVNRKHVGIAGALGCLGNVAWVEVDSAFSFGFCSACCEQKPLQDVVLQNEISGFHFTRGPSDCCMVDSRARRVGFKLMSLVTAATQARGGSVAVKLTCKARHWLRGGTILEITWVAY